MTTGTATLMPAAYLELERRQEGKHEYENETLIPLGGGTKEHNRIAGNLFGFIWSFLRASGLDAQVYQADLRVQAPSRGKYYYPDVVVTLGEEVYSDSASDTLLNPCLLIEVLSDSTEARDRGIKFDAYRSIDSLKEYVLVAQDRLQLYRTNSGFGAAGSLSPLGEKGARAGRRQNLSWFSIEGFYKNERGTSLFRFAAGM